MNNPSFINQMQPLKIYFCEIYLDLCCDHIDSPCRMVQQVSWAVVVVNVIKQWQMEAKADYDTSELRKCSLFLTLPIRTNLWVMGANTK